MRVCIFLHAVRPRELKNGKSITPSDAARSLSLLSNIYFSALGPLFSLWRTSDCDTRRRRSVVVVYARGGRNGHARNDGHCCEQKAARDLYLHLGRPFAT